MKRQDSWLTPVIFLVAGVAFLWLSYEGWTSGVVTARGGAPVHRAYDPGGFNVILAIQGILGSGSLVGAVVSARRLLASRR